MAEFQIYYPDFRDEQITIIVASVDPREKAPETVERLGISYPVGYEVKAKEISSLTGAFYEPEKKFLHATGFLVHPDRSVNVAYYRNTVGAELGAKLVQNRKQKA